MLIVTSPIDMLFSVNSYGKCLHLFNSQRLGFELYMKTLQLNQNLHSPSRDGNTTEVINTTENTFLNHHHLLHLSLIAHLSHILYQNNCMFLFQSHLLPLWLMALAFCERVSEWVNKQVSEFLGVCVYWRSVLAAITSANWRTVCICFKRIWYWKAEDRVLIGLQVCIIIIYKIYIVSRNTDLHCWKP